MTTTTTNFTINTLPKTKKEIVERLFRDKHIDLDEVLELMKDTQTITVTPVTPQQPWVVPTYPVYPSIPVSPYWYTTCNV